MGIAEVLDFRVMGYAVLLQSHFAEPTSRTLQIYTECNAIHTQLDLMFFAHGNLEPKWLRRRESRLRVKSLSYVPTPMKFRNFSRVG